MKILLIHPEYKHGPVTGQDRGTFRAKLFSNPEMTLPAVAATVPKKHSVRIIHENFENIDYSGKYDIVGISCFTMFAPQAYEIADKFRNNGTKICSKKSACCLLLNLKMFCHNVIKHFGKSILFSCANILLS